MTELLQFTVIGIITGAVYAIAASGLVLTYTTTGVFNFAHGAVGMAAAYAYYWLRTEQGVPAPLALAVVLFAFAPLAGALTARVMRRFRGASPAVTLVVTIALTLLLIGLAQAAFDPRTARRLPPLLGDHSVHVVGVVVTYDQMAILLIAVAMAASLRWLLHRTRTGLTMRATVDDADLAEFCGARLESVEGLSWMLGYFLAAVAGVLLASGQTLQPDVLALLVLSAYAAATFGRMRSLPLTIAGAIGLGLVQAWTGVHYLFPAGQFWDRLRLAIPGLFLYGSLLLLPEARLSAARARARSIRAPRPRTAVAGAAALIVVVSILAAAAPADRVTTLLGGMVLAIPMLSLVLLTGFAGQISLATYVFMALGAWAMSVVVVGGGLLGLAFAAVVAIPLGLLVALPAMRLQGLYLALATFALAIVGRELLVSDPHIFGGRPRLITRPAFLGLSFSSDRSLLVLVTIVFALLGVAVAVARRGWPGRRLAAMRDSEVACATLGMDVRVVKAAAFVASAAIASVGGALFGAYSRAVSDFQWEPLFNIILIVFVFAAGIDSVSGALLGGMLLSWFAVVQSKNPVLAGLVFAGVSVLVIQLGRQPGGLVGVAGDRARALGEWFSRTRATERPLPAPAAPLERISGVRS